MKLHLLLHHEAEAGSTSDNKQIAEPKVVLLVFTCDCKAADILLVQVKIMLMCFACGWTKITKIRRIT
ncbi:MAG: hypothetical protein LBI63_03385 [Candidatus Ancillula sp.]|jgi:hypothetical protein|nr:hypothetical protein [Candidatus Ancillula sp.]